MPHRIEGTDNRAMAGRTAAVRLGAAAAQVDVIECPYRRPAYRRGSGGPPVAASVSGRRLRDLDVRLRDLDVGCRDAAEIAAVVERLRALAEVELRHVQRHPDGVIAVVVPEGAA